MIPPDKKKPKDPDAKMLAAAQALKANDLIEIQLLGTAIKEIKLWEPPKQAELNRVFLQDDKSTAIEVTDTLDTKTIVIPKSKMAP